MTSLSKASPAKYTFTYIVFAIIFSLSVLCLLLLSSLLGGKRASSETSTDVPSESKRITVVIDAGHGGEDGGAIGDNGIYEKELNLSIAKDLAAMLKASGINVVMTRESDVLLYDKNADHHGRKKQLDLAARVRIADENRDCIFVSIHMNSFPQKQYRGLQVYYSGNDPSSRDLAESIQVSVCEYLQRENKRKVKSASSNIYLLDRITSPAVLVECGFISNAEECELLSSEDYRQRLTLAIFCGIAEYIYEYSS